MKVSSILLLLILGSAPVLRAANLINEDFETAPANPNSLGWYSSTAGTTTFSAATGALQFTASSNATNQSVFKQFSTTSIDVGQIMTLTMRATALSDAPDVSSMWRIGLFNTSNTFTSNQGLTPWSTVNEGYILGVPTANSEGGGTNQANIYYKQGNAGIVSTTGATGASSVSLVNDRMPSSGVTPVTFSLSVERLSSTEVRVAASWLENGAVGGTLPSMVLNSSDPKYIDSFNTIYFAYGAGAEGRTFTIDDVRLSLEAVPEPSSMLLAAGGVLLCGLRRRR